MHWYLEALRKATDFESRARRVEYWSYMLINTVGGFLVGLSTHRWSGTHLSIWSVTLTVLLAIIAFIPGFAVSVRRLHDTNRSGWWILLSAIPIVGSIALFIFAIQDSDAGDNQYGPNPKAEMIVGYSR